MGGAVTKYQNSTDVNQKTIHVSITVKNTGNANISSLKIGVRLHQLVSGGSIDRDYQYPSTISLNVGEEKTVTGDIYQDAIGKEILSYFVPDTPSPIEVHILYSIDGAPTVEVNSGWIINLKTIPITKQITITSVTVS
jgi:hypothetical protein